MLTAESIAELARDVLVLKGAAFARDNWLWEHSERVMRQARLIALLPEFGNERPDPIALAAGALFHDAGWAVQFRQSQVTHGQLLARPTSDVQRELGVRAMLERLTAFAPSDSLQLAAAAIRECNNRETELPEAIAISEAENLDEIGVLGVLRLFRQHQFEGRPIEQLLSSWTRQLEYHYWDARINDYLRFETTRRLAHERLASVETMMAALARDREAADLTQVVKEAGVDLAREFPKQR